MIKGKIPNALYLIHTILILILWGIFFYLFFFSKKVFKLNYSKNYFYLTEIVGFFLISLGFFFLRKSSLSDDEKKMFKLAKKGDFLLISGFLISFLSSFFYRNIDLSICITLATLIILQTHFPLVEDESFYPEELKNENMI